MGTTVQALQRRSGTTVSGKLRFRVSGKKGAMFELGCESACE